MFSMTDDADGLRITDVTCNLSTAITWTYMISDDIAGSSFSSVYSGGIGEMPIAIDIPFYLAFQTYELFEYLSPESGYGDVHLGDAHYGWVELKAADSDTIEVLASAINLDANPMVVGGGAIPEPTSAAFAVLGLCVLALPRVCRAQYEGCAWVRPRQTLSSSNCAIFAFARGGGYDKIWA